MNELSLILEKTSSPKEAKVKASQYHLKPSQIELFISTLSKLIRAGIPLLRAVQILEKEAPGPRLKSLLKVISKDLQEGFSLAMSLERTSSFPPYAIQMIEAGESSGSLETILGNLNTHLRKQEEFRKKMIEALAYPGFILFTGFLTMTVLLKFVIPKIAELYAEGETQLPLLTRMILSLSEAFGPLLIGGGIILGFSLFLFNRRKDALLNLSIHFPIWKHFLMALFRVHFSGLLATLLKSGLSILVALEMLQKTLQVQFWQIRLGKMREDLAQGSSISEALQSIDWFDGISRSLLFAGQESGSIIESLERIAQDTEAHLENQCQLMVKMLEPCMILGVGIIIGVMVIGTLLPIFEIQELMR